MQLLDDANMPNVLSLPLLGVADGDGAYARTRARILSADNPYFVSGSAGSGLGSPHSGGERPCSDCTPENMVWPMGLIAQALTSEDDGEIAQCLGVLKRSAAAARTGLMHESFYKDDARYFTRRWFAWANSAFGALVLRVLDERPHLLLLPGA